MRAFIAGAVLLLTACTTNVVVGHAKVSLAVKGVAGNVKGAPAVALRPAMRGATLLPSEIAGVSFTPERVFVPITRITLNGSIFEVVDGEKVHSPNLSSQEVYRCPGPTPQDCLVEISSPAAVEAFSAKLRDLSVVEGVYETISVYNGTGDGDSFVKGKLRAKGSFALQGVTYYTGSTGPVTDATANDFTEFEISKGAWDFPIVANGVLSVLPDDALTISLFANYDALLFGLQLSSLDGDQNGCPANLALELSVCATEPAIVGFVGETAPSLEYYALTFSGSGWYDGMTGLLVFVLDGEGNLIGILPKQYLTGAVGSKTPNFFGAVESFIVNPDGSIDIAKGSAGNPGYFTIDGFTRQDHEGTVTLEAQGAGHYAADKR